MPPAAGPIRPEERILALDIVRGVALLGIFVMNVPGFSHSLFAGAGGAETFVDPLNRVAASIREALFAGKFNSMFSLLFGIGFTLQLGRLRATDPQHATLVYVRRLVVLFAIGLVHAGLLWSGDVLLVYALLGFALLLLQRAPDSLLVALIGACLMLQGVFEAWRPYLVSAGAEALAAFDYPDLEASNNQAFGQGSFLDAAGETWRMLAWGYGTTMGRWSYALFYAHMASGLLLGYLAGRRGWLGPLSRDGPRLRRLQWAALALGVVGALVHLAGRPGVLFVEVAPAALFVTTTMQALGRLALMVFYVLSVVRLAELPIWRDVLRPFADAGRMPLTNYLLQTALGTFIFYGWGLGWWGRVGPAAELLLAPLLFVAIQLPLSAWWLRRHRQGPLEHAWRALSYGRPLA
jgi:uncharacterized protein